MLSGGLSLVEALDVLRVSSRNARLTTALHTIGAALRGGALLSNAAASAPELFPPGERGLLEVGELTGRLPEVLTRMAAALSRRAAVRRNLLKSSAYPVFLLVMATLSLPLPELVTARGIGGYLVQAGSGLALLVGLVCLVIFAPRLMARRDLGTGLRRFAWKAPVFGFLYRPGVRAETLQAAAIGIASGLGLPQTLRLASIASGDPSAADACREIARRVDAGSDLSSAFAAVDFLPPAMLLSITGGERGGDLDVVLARLAEESLAEHERRTGTALKVFGWTLMAVVFGVLAYKIIGQAQTVTGVPDDVLRQIEREIPGVFKPMR
jgi:type II secretory pathway component PulF